MSLCFAEAGGLGDRRRLSLRLCLLCLDSGPRLPVRQVPRSRPRCRYPHRHWCWRPGRLRVPRPLRHLPPLRSHSRYRPPLLPLAARPSRRCSSVVGGATLAPLCPRELGRRVPCWLDGTPGIGRAVWRLWSSRSVAPLPRSRLPHRRLRSLRLGVCVRSCRFLLSHALRFRGHSLPRPLPFCLLRALSLSLCLLGLSPVLPGRRRFFRSPPRGPLRPPISLPSSFGGPHLLRVLHRGQPTPIGGFAQWLAAWRRDICGRLALRVLGVPPRPGPLLPVCHHCPCSLCCLPHNARSSIHTCHVRTRHTATRRSPALSPPARMGAPSHPRTRTHTVAFRSCRATCSFRPVGSVA